jgi:hypothetical protein
MKLGASKRSVLHLQMLASTLGEDDNKTISIVDELLKELEASPNDHEWLSVQTDAVNFGLQAASRIHDKILLTRFLATSASQQKRLTMIISNANETQIDAETIAGLKESILLLLTTRLSVEMASNESQDSRLNLIADLSSAVDVTPLDSEDSFLRITTVIGRIAASSNSRNHHLETINLLFICFSLFERKKRLRELVNICSQIGEMYSLIGDSRKVDLWFGRAENWLEECINTFDEHMRHDFASKRCMLRAGIGRSKFRLGMNSSVCSERLREINHALRSFTWVRDFIDANSAMVTGDVSMFIADIKYWLGLTYQELGDFQKAAISFSECRRTNGLLEDERFWRQIGSDATINETRSWILAGKMEDARVAIDECQANQLFSKSSQEKINYLRAIIEEDLQPVVDWFHSTDAQKLQDLGSRNTAQAISEIVKPLSDWWAERGVLENELLYDFWGRGAFSRIASAVRGAPHDVIAVDASSLEEIRYAARVFCPLFETVLIKWKGPLSLDGWLAVCEIPDVLSDNAPTFGGHGYIQAAGSDGRWSPSTVTGNYLGLDIIGFIHNEAYDLFRQGRLIVLPAPLVGCTQSSVGWSDELLLGNFLSGVVSTVGTRKEGDVGERACRTINLCELKIPYIKDVSLYDLAMSLEQLKEHTSPLRDLVGEHLQSGNLKNENWATLSKVGRDFKEASRFFSDRLKSFCNGKYSIDVSGSHASVTAIEREDSMPGTEPVTDFLRSICPIPENQSPYVVFWQLQSKGGVFDWTCPINNPNSTQSSNLMPDVPFSNRMRGWLVPGTLGVRIGRSRKL